MRERFERPSLHESTQDAQDVVGSSMRELAGFIQTDPGAERTFRTVYPSQIAPGQAWSAKYVPQQYGVVFPQLDIAVVEQSRLAPDAQERQLVMPGLYDLIFDMGHGERAHEAQFGAVTTYRYLQTEEGVSRGVNFRPYIALGRNKYWVPDGYIRGFGLLPGGVEHRAQLVLMQLELAALDGTDAARVAAAVEWFRQT